MSQRKIQRNWRACSLGCAGEPHPHIDSPPCVLPTGQAPGTALHLRGKMTAKKGEREWGESRRKQRVFQKGPGPSEGPACGSDLPPAHTGFFSLFCSEFPRRTYTNLFCLSSHSCHPKPPTTSSNLVTKAWLIDPGLLDTAMQNGPFLSSLSWLHKGIRQGSYLASHSGFISISSSPLFSAYPKPSRSNILTTGNPLPWPASFIQLTFPEHLH